MLYSICSLQHLNKYSRLLFCLPTRPPSTLTGGRHVPGPETKSRVQRPCPHPPPRSHTCRQKNGRLLVLSSRTNVQVVIKYDRNRSSTRPEIIVSLAVCTAFSSFTPRKQQQQPDIKTPKTSKTSKITSYTHIRRHLLGQSPVDPPEREQCTLFAADRRSLCRLPRRCPSSLPPPRRRGSRFLNTPSRVPLARVPRPTKQPTSQPTPQHPPPTNARRVRCGLAPSFSRAAPQQPWKTS